MTKPLAYYNEFEPAAAHLLRCLIEDGVIAPGHVDERSIKDVEPSDLEGYTQAHFFAGGGLWSVATRLAGWPDDRPLWSGSAPCQPFSVAGKGAGEMDPRHLWPDFFRLIRVCRPPVVVGEQVAGAAGYRWFDGVAADLEGEDYACRAVDIPACAVDAPHIRQRLYWVAVGDAARERRGEGRAEHEVWRRGAAPSSAGGNDMADAACGIRKDRMGVHGPQGQHVGHGAGTVRRGCSWDDPTGSAEMFGGDAKAPRLFNMADANEPRLEGWRAAAERADQFALGPHGLADADRGGRAGRTEASQRGAERGTSLERIGGDMADADKLGPGEERQQRGGQLVWPRKDQRARAGSFWSDYEWRTGADGKARRVKPGVRLLVDGLPGRVGLLRIAGNAIVPQLAAEALRALMDVYDPYADFDAVFGLPEAWK